MVTTITVAATDNGEVKALRFNGIPYDSETVANALRAYEGRPFPPDSVADEVREGRRVPRYPDGARITAPPPEPSDMDTVRGPGNALGAMLGARSREEFDRLMKADGPYVDSGSINHALPPIEVLRGNPKGDPDAQDYGAATDEAEPVEELPGYDEGYVEGYAAGVADYAPTHERAVYAREFLHILLNAESKALATEQARGRETRGLDYVGLVTFAFVIADEFLSHLPDD